MSHLWDSRGYRPPNIDQNKGPLEDERGEEAYMRAFQEAEKIGRVPNPAFFTNSLSAKDYIARRDAQLFGQASRDQNASDEPRRKPNPNYVPILRAPNQSRNPIQAPTQSRSSLPPSLPSAAKSPTPRPTQVPPTMQTATQTPASGKVQTLNGHHATPRFADPRVYRGQVPPLIMEPTFGPVGPPKMLR